MKKLLRKLRSGDGGGLNALSSLIAVLAGLLVGLIVLLLTNPAQAFPAFRTILTVGFQESRNFGQILFHATPIILTGLSVGFAMKTGLFNIGAPGQFAFGAFVSIFVSLEATFLPPGIRLVVAILCAMLAGALWGAIPGLLKAYRNVHEVISCIMTNWIGIFLVNWLIERTIVQTARNATPYLPGESTLPGLGLGELFQGAHARASNVDIGILIAILAAVFVYIVLDKTKFGYELKACGFNQHAAKYAGISEKRNVIFSMMISGALAALGGALLYTSAAGFTMQVADTLYMQGFTGISVALLGLNHPIGIIFGGILIGYLQEGGIHIQRFFAPELIEMVVSIIIYFCAFVLLFKMLLHRISNKLFGQSEPPANPADPPPDAEDSSQSDDDESLGKEDSAL